MSVKIMVDVDVLETLIDGFNRPVGFNPTTFQDLRDQIKRARETDARR